MDGEQTLVQEPTWMRQPHAALHPAPSGLGTLLQGWWCAVDHHQRYYHHEARAHVQIPGQVHDTQTDQMLDISTGSEFF